MTAEQPPTEAAKAARLIAGLEADVKAARAAEQSERDRREAAEASRDQWIAIAQRQGVVLGKTQGLGDPQLAIDAAYAAESRTRRRLEEHVSLVLRRDQTIEGLVRLVRMLPKLPAPPKKLHPDVAMAVRWALSDRTAIAITAAPQVALPASVLAELDAVAEEWEAVRRYSMAKIEEESRRGI